MANYICTIGNTTGHETLIGMLSDVFNGRIPPVSALPADIMWRRHDEHAVTCITEDGDLILDIRDLFTQRGFWRHSLLDAWAGEHFLDLSGWDHPETYWTMFEATLFPAVTELLGGDDLLDAFNEVMNGADVPKLPELRILVNGPALALHLVTHFEGPFDSDEDTQLALERRTLRPTSPFRNAQS